MGGIGVLWKFRIAKIILFHYPRWPPWWPAWNTSNHISSQTVSQIELKPDGRHRGDMEICSIIQFQYPRWQSWWQSWSSSDNIRYWISKGNLICGHHGTMQHVMISLSPGEWFLVHGPLVFIIFVNGLRIHIIHNQSFVIVARLFTFRHQKYECILFFYVAIFNITICVSK